MLMKLKSTAIEDIKTVFDDMTAEKEREDDSREETNPVIVPPYVTASGALDAFSCSIC